MLKPGPRNLITDVDGILVGSTQDPALRSGVSVVLCETPSVASVDVRGGAPGTRDTDLLDPSCRVDRVDAICLSGGSAFGLSAADGVMRWLRERGRGIAIADVVVPIVPTAILFDLLNGGDKDWDWPPYRELAYEATGKAARDFALGNIGAGMGAKAGNLKGGLGSASAVDPASGLLEQQGEFGDLGPPAHGLALPVSHARADLTHDPADAARSDPRANTTIAVLATNARLDKASAERLAMMAQDGLARSIRPVHTPQDGDTVFAIATGRHDLGADPLALGELGTLAADCLARAIGRAIYLAKGLPFPGALPDWKSKFQRNLG